MKKKKRSNLAVCYLNEHFIEETFIFIVILISLHTRVRLSLFKTEINLHQYLISIRILNLQYFIKIQRIFFSFQIMAFFKMIRLNEIFVLTHFY